MKNNSSLLPNVSHYVITNINNLANYARILSQYHHITQNQQRLFISSADNLESARNNGKLE